MTASFRPMKPDDRAFVRSGWSSSYRNSPYAGLIAMERYAETMHAQIETILDRADTRVIVAYEPGEHDHLARDFLYGFIATRVARAPYVYYVYVKKPYRHGREQGMARGYASLLFEAAGVDPREPFSYACKTSYCEQFATKIPRARFDSIAGRYPNQKEPTT